MTGEQQSRRAERLHVMVSSGCNNDCVFCLEDRLERRLADFGDPFEILEKFPHRDSVLFTCGEPTLHPKLVGMVQRASFLGYQSIGLVTNGRLLGKNGLGRRLVDAGLTEVTVSIHSHRPEIHDRMVGRRAFLQTLHGLDLMVAARAGGLVVKTSTVVTLVNLPDLTETVSFLAGRGVEVVNLNYVEPAGKAALAFDRLAPRMSEVAAVVSRIPEGCCRELVVTGMPPCLLGGAGRSGLREIIWLFKEGRFVRLEPNRRQVYGPPCDSCLLKNSCDGIWRLYADRYGWSEFSPVAVSET